MLIFKSNYRNQTLVLADGTLVNSDNVKSNHCQNRLKESASFAFMFEEEKNEMEAPEPLVKKKKLGNVKK